MSVPRYRLPKEVAAAYEVGYGKPPKAHQFSPGQSGNPSGRPKGSRSLKTDLADELAELVSVIEGGRSRKLTKQQALLRRSINTALNGDSRTSIALLGLIMKFLGHEPLDSTERQLEPEDDEILADYLRRATEG